MLEDKEILATLICRACEGDQQAWADLYKETVRGAYFTAKKVLNSEEDAIDLVHDAYITAFERLEQLEDPKKFEAWLVTIVANKCRDYLRRKKPLLFTDIYEEETSEVEWEDLSLNGKPDIVLDHQETIRLVAEMIESLPEDQKLCVILYYRDELSVGQIAQALEISEGTVKSRLNYARKRIKEKVEDLEKKGTKLYGLAPLPLLGMLLREEASAAEIPEVLLKGKELATGLNAGTSAGNTMTVAAKAVAGSTVLSSVGVKIAAGVTAIAVLGGGVVYTIQKPDLPESNTIQAYEEFLAEEISPSGMEMNFYTYLDLDSDENPELLVTDCEGTADDWTAGELYCYNGEEVAFCTSLGTRYAPFYVVNESEILCRSRLGAQYVGMQESFSTASYHWDEALTRKDPAIQKNDGEWEYITQEEYDYYNPVLDETFEPGTNSYVKVFELLTLSSNPFVSIILAEELDFLMAWTASETSTDRVKKQVTFAFFEDGSCYCFCETEMAVFDKCYRGTYTEERGTVMLDLTATDGTAVKCNYQIIKKTNGVDLIQLSEVGVVEQHDKGKRLSLRENERFTAKDYRIIADGLWWSTPEAEIGTDYYCVNVPESWKDKYVVKYDVTGRLTQVYEKECYKEFGGGLLFEVNLYEKDFAITDLPKFVYIGECTIGGQVYHVVALIPTDVRFIPEYQEQYLALAKDVTGICENVRVVDSGD